MRRVLLGAALALAALSAAPAVAADETPPAGKAPAGDAGKAGSSKSESATPEKRLDRAKQLVKQLEESIARAKAATPVDAQLLSTLLAALEQAKALAKPVKLAELTPEEIKSLGEEAKKANPDGGAPPKDPAADAANAWLAKAFDGADLGEEEQIKAKQIIGDWWKDTMGSLGDSKKTSDLKKKRDDDLEKAVGKQKARKVINNLNAMQPGRR